ncbi:Rpp20 subunit of nuclear RNase MRP and P-domain-containing protein [Dichotomopilus funicola]|uniref:Rpp20 subunit of nuclear RNase MRP and P-domain-containing protein n=1 Tax=Dichotomopilus funicola TaxID=1934379 RepID=A0AAN6UX60_9PEZI|nr:Rpp20 subunit of nuclear RNase MRP and P-domain-containing protein [Dichotomopilus funicola]
MAPTTPADNGASQNTALVNKPDTKLPPIPNGSRIVKRPLPGPSPSAYPRARPHTQPQPQSHRQPPNKPTTTTTTTTKPPTTATLPALLATADSDGYIPPPRAAHTAVLKVSSSASFMSLVRRARKILDRRATAMTMGSGRTGGAKGLPSLAARVAALGGSNAANGSGNGGGHSGFVTDGLDDVLFVATGRAIEKAVELACFFQRERELIVLMRTRSVKAVDDVVAADEEADVEDGVRVRNLSSLEVGIRWAS